MGIDLRNVPNRLKLYREMEGYTQKDVASILSFKNSAVISSWELGTSRPSLEYVLKLSILYHTLPGELFCDLYTIYRNEIVEARKKFEASKLSNDLMLPKQKRKI